MDSTGIEFTIPDSDSIQKEISNLIMILFATRKKKKISQKQLAEMTGLPQSTISRMESFQSTPTLPVLIKIATALELSLKLE